MGWREKMGSAVAIAKTETLEQKEQKEQKGVERGAFATIATIAPKIGNEKAGYPIPDTEPEFAMDERAAIIDVDGGQDETIPYSGPVEMVLENSILGTTVDITLEPGRAVVDGVVYSKTEMVDLLSRSLSAAEVAEIHRIKQSFDGSVVPSVKN
jgi:hypothetical protein